MFNRHLRSIFVAAFFACVFLSVQQAARAANVWTKIESQNFVLVGNASETEIRSVALRLERFRSTIRSIVPPANGTSFVRTNVVVFRDAAAFRPFKPKRVDGTTDDLVAGLFIPGSDINYIAISASNESSGNYGTIFHEYAHDLLNANLGTADIPPWLNEGLAEYFQTFQIIDDRTASLGGIQAAHLNLLRQKPWMPWDDFFKLDNFTLHQNGDHSRTIFYAQAWALTNFLIRRMETSAMLKRGDTIENVLNVISPKEILRLAAELDRSVIDAGVKEFVTKISTETPTARFASKPVTVSQKAVLLSDAETNSYLGELLYHLRDDASAETFLQKALSLEPRLSSANATLGLIRLRQRKFNAAKHLLEISIAADQKNHLVHFYYAYLLSREQMDEFGSVVDFSAADATKIRESLGRAIALNPSFGESYKLLAFVGMITDDLGGALSAISKASALQPANQEYALLTAQILLRQEKVAEARAIAEKLYRTANNIGLKNEASILIKSADRYDTEKTAGDKMSINVLSNIDRKPIILKWKSLTKEEIERIDLDREIQNLNLLIEHPKVGELQVVGSIEKIGCGNDRIFYIVKTMDGLLRLSGKSFDDLRIKVLLNGTRSFAFRCDARITAETAVFVYKPNRKYQAGSDGELVSVAFVPKYFKLKTPEELAGYTTIIIEGGPTADISKNATNARVERDEMERTMRETQIADLEERLRKPAAGERQIAGIPEKVECSAGKVFYSVRSSEKIITFESLLTENVDIRSFTPETGVIETGCRAVLPPAPAIFTYKPSAIAEGAAQGVLLSIEFIPKSYVPRKLND